MNLNLPIAVVKIQSEKVVANCCDTKWKAIVSPILVVFSAVAVIFTPIEVTGGETSKELTLVQGLQKAQPSPHIVFLINEDPNNYEAHKTIPAFAEMLHVQHGFKTTVIRAEGELPAIRFPGLDIITEADLIVVFFRRAALPINQLKTIKNYLGKGKPLVGIRTANHAFAVRSQDGKIPDGYEDWPEFVPHILGQVNQGYGSIEQGTAVAVVPEAADHAILEGIPAWWQSPGNIYRVKLLDEEATLLLNGSAGEGDVEPIAYNRIVGKSRIFYTSLGYPADFKMSPFSKLLVNGIRWTLNSN